jgi:hypothetical protein
VNVLVTTNKHLDGKNEFERCISPIELKCIKKINYTYQIPMYLYLCRIDILTIKMYFDCQQQFCLFNELVKP